METSIWFNAHIQTTRSHIQFRSVRCSANAQRDRRRDNFVYFVCDDDDVDINGFYDVAWNATRVCIRRASGYAKMDFRLDFPPILLDSIS